jgi:hypothetical protein
MLASFLITPCAESPGGSLGGDECKQKSGKPSVSLARFRVKGQKQKRGQPPQQKKSAEVMPSEAATTVLYHEFKPLPASKQPPKQAKKAPPPPPAAESDSDEDGFDDRPLGGGVSVGGEAEVAGGVGDGGSEDGGEWEPDSDVDLDEDDVASVDYATSEDGTAGSDYSMASSLGETSFSRHHRNRRKAATGTMCGKPVYTGPQLCAEEEDFD